MVAGQHLRVASVSATRGHAPNTALGAMAPKRPAGGGGKGAKGRGKGKGVGLQGKGVWHVRGHWRPVGTGPDRDAWGHFPTGPVIPPPPRHSPHAELSTRIEQHGLAIALQLDTMVNGALRWAGEVEDNAYVTSVAHALHIENARARMYFEVDNLMNLIAGVTGFMFARSEVQRFLDRPLEPGTEMARQSILARVAAIERRRRAREHNRPNPDHPPAGGGAGPAPPPDDDDDAQMDTGGAASSAGIGPGGI